MPLSPLNVFSLQKHNTCIPAGLPASSTELGAPFSTDPKAGAGVGEPHTGKGSAGSENRQELVHS